MKRIHFIPGKTYIPVSGKVFDRQEIKNGITAVKDGWWTEGRFALDFEKKFAKMLGVKYVTLTNSGSSANLLALSALTATVFGDKAIKPGDEIITSACCFPTTVNPIIQNRCKPVFIDVDIHTKNPTVESVARAITKKTKAIILAHTLGNPLPLDGIIKMAKKYHLWLIEDACDALGATYNRKQIGSFGNIAIFSFYPAHQITMGEGGAIVTSNPLIYKSIRQFRDWGRDCWCGTGEDDTCHNRFGWKMGALPRGYDHKYIYSQIGYNLKLTDMQAAIGLAQLKKLNTFVKARQNNFENYRKFFSGYPDFFILTQPEMKSIPSWFGFTLIIKDNAPFTKSELVKYFEDHRIGTRSLFSGNLTRHPAYVNRHDIRISGQLVNADRIMERGFWIGVFPGITPEMLEYVKKTFREFLQHY
jgi:CDP-6-deoxy-D-xylo-4-hexulose-3-dehydrase